MNNKARYAIIMLISVLMNQVFFTLGDIYHWPMWLDTTGTALAALVLEPTAGLIVGLINNFYIANFVFDSSTLIYYGVSAAIAIIVGVNMRVNGKLSLKRLLPTMLLVVLVASTLSSLLTMWRSGGVSNSPWEQYYYQIAAGYGAPNIVSCFFGTLVVRVYDTIVSTVVIGVFYVLLPKCLKTARVEPKQ